MKAGIAFLAALIILPRFAFGAGVELRATTLDVDVLNSRLQAEKVGWIAEKNEVSQMSMSDFKNRLGLKLVKHPAVHFRLPELSTLLVAGHVDWRDRGGSNWVSPILNQGRCGSCVAFAAVGVLETQYKIASGFPGMNVKFSPQFLFSCGGGRCDWGWTPDEASSFLKTTGVTDEACMPYTSGAAGSDMACNQACADHSGRAMKIASYVTPTNDVMDLNALRKALAKGPVVTTLEVYEDFMLYSKGIYKHVTGKALGGHAVSIVGYDDATRAFIVRNSWGETWGENGFVRVSYDDISGIGESTWSYDLPTPNTISLDEPRDQAYATGELAIKVSNVKSNATRFDATVYDSTGTVYWKGAFATSIDVSPYPDGRYELEVTGYDSAGQPSAVSQRRYFYVMNQQPALTLSFTSDQQSSFVKGIVSVTVNGSSTSVPMNEIEVHYKDADGKDTVVEAPFPASPLVLKWKTTSLKNGDYDMWMVGRAHSNNKVVSVESTHQTLTVKN